MDISLPYTYGLIVSLTNLAKNPVRTNERLSINDIPYEVECAIGFSIESYSILQVPNN
jgi:hypothetical protein